LTTYCQDIRTLNSRSILAIYSRFALNATAEKRGKVSSPKITSGDPYDRTIFRRYP
jgi:hypothetical protein